MSSLDLSKMSAADAVTALRSYPRRYRQTVLPIADDPEVEQLATRVGPSGHAALDLVVDTTGSWVLLGQALHRVLVEDGPVLHAGVTDAAERDFDPPPGTSVEAELARLDDEAQALADAIGRVHGREWDRPATTTAGAAVTALDLVREAVRVGADNLGEAERTISAIRRG